MPEYSSLAVLKQKFDVAIQEGSYNFTLSWLIQIKLN